MRKFEVTGLLAGKKGRKVTQSVLASSKQVIWNNPSAYGFSKLFSVVDNNKVNLSFKGEE